MNQDPLDPALDAMLHAWSDSTQADASAIDSLRRRIVDAAVEAETRRTDSTSFASDSVAASGPATKHDQHAVVVRSPVGHEPATGDKSREPSSSVAEPRGRAWFGTALAVVLGAVLFRVAWQNSASGPATRSPHSDAASVDPSMETVAAPPAEKLHTQRRLLANLDELFERRVEWFVETPERVEMDVGDEAPVGSGTDGGGIPLALRFVVQSRESSSAPWRTTWSLDVVARNERVVRIPAAAAAGVDVEFWAFTLPDGMIHVERHVALADDQRTQLHSTALLPRNRPIVVEQTARSGRTYRVIQWASPLAPDLG